VALAKLLLRPANVLLLDEPTNHLDPLTKERLEEALRRFNGTVIIASHDRFLLDRVAKKIGEVADTQLKLYLGSYSEVRQQRATQAGAQAAVGQAAAGVGRAAASNGTAVLRASNGAAPVRPVDTPPLQGNGVGPSAVRQMPSSARKRGGKGVSPLVALEAELDRRVRERVELEARLASPEGEDVATLGQQHVALEQAIAELEARWELLAEEASA
jgi:ABC-type multidrug transport system ATPase subunit